MSSVATPASTRKRRRRRGTKLQRRQTRLAWLLLLPALAAVAFVAIYPLGKTVYQSFTNEEFLQKHPDVVRKFVKVLVRASDWTNANHDEAGQIFARRRGLDPRYAGSWQYYEHVLVPGPEPVQWWIDLLVREGKLKQGQIAAGDVYSNEFNPFAKHASR